MVTVIDSTRMMESAAAVTAALPVAPVSPAPDQAVATAAPPTLLPSGAEVRETSPHGRYAKLNDKLGSGAYKDVWRAYDTNEGIEVAWNVVKLNRVPPNERKRIKTEVKLLKDIQHKNVIKYYNSWVDRDKEQIVFITEIMSSGSLKDYLRKNPLIRWHAVKRWARQILRGLEFLHANHVIHRDIKCDNIFINGATGDIRIGDLGLSTKIAEGGMLPPHNNNRQITASAMTCLGTPEFMAPELYEENYDEKVDIYAFGMCLLEIATGLTPYHQCTSAAQIYKKVLRGDLPPELSYTGLAAHPTARSFIEACLQPLLKRPSAEELLTHPFFQPNETGDYSEVRAAASLGDPALEEAKEEEEEDEHEDSSRRSTPSVCDEPLPSVLAGTANPNPSEPSVASECPDVDSKDIQAAPAGIASAAGTREEPAAEGKRSEAPQLPTPPAVLVETQPPSAARPLHSSSIGSSRLVRRLKTSAGGSSTYFSTSQTFDGSVLQVLSSSQSAPRPKGDGELSSSSSDVVTVVNIEDHALNDNSLVFFLRAPVIGERREVEIEFEFALGRDDTKTILAELRDCEEMAGSPIDIRQLTRVLEPLVDAGLLLSSGWRADGHLSLSHAIIASIVKRLDWSPEMTEALRELTSRQSASRVRAPRVPSRSGGVDSIGINDELDDDADDLSPVDVERTPDYQNILLEHQRATLRIEKDLQQRVLSVNTNRERLEEAHRKEIESLNARRGDLEKQLTSMREKFRERMDVLDAKKARLELGRSRLLSAEAPATATS